MKNARALKHSSIRNVLPADLHRKCLLGSRIHYDRRFYEATLDLPLLSYPFAAVRNFYSGRVYDDGGLLVKFHERDYVHLHSRNPPPYRSVIGRFKTVNALA